MLAIASVLFAVLQKVVIRVLKSHPTPQQNKQMTGGLALCRFLESDIKKFQALYEANFGLALDKYEARRELALLVRQVEIVYQPVSLRQLEGLLARGSRG